MHNETLMFVGKDDVAPLMFDATEIISVRSYDLKTTYVLGEDYTVVNNCIVLTENTRIPFFTLDEYYPSTSSSNAFGCTVSGKPYVYFSESGYIPNKQIVVTYKHNGDYNYYVPVDQSAEFDTTLKKLENKQSTKILFYGDSITVGCNSSGIIGIAPHAPNWATMVTEFLKDKYGTNNLTYINTAVGGKTAGWGLENVQANVIDYAPDMVVLGFGMNDVGLSMADYKATMKQMIDTIRAALPNCEIVLVSTMLPNAESTYYGNQYLQEAELQALADAYDGVGVAKMTSMHQSVLQTKRFYDMTGNNINHTNDFLARLYAMTVLQTLGQYAN
ncbi:MAG: SGNH/GDSL hydrolase family protein [Clostridiales bacterium]|nr:SGNH/GDSL hydrolase family protein [Clostridiales bacterium]